MIKPMLANPAMPEDIPKFAARDYWMEPKLDGVRCVIEKNAGGVTAHTRSGKDLTAKIPHLIEQVRQHGPTTCCLDGELGYFSESGVYHVIDFNRTMRVVGSGVGEALRKQKEEGELDFVVFDMVYDDFTNMEVIKLKDRRAALEEAYYGDGKYKMGSPLVQAPNIWLSQVFGDATTVLYEGMVREGCEGTMLKNPNSYYFPSKRPAQTWYKLKKFQTIDVRIVGFKPGEGKYADLVGAIRFHDPDTGLYGWCSGMTDEQRTHISNNRHDYIDKIMEIKHFGLVGRGDTGYRHPQFVRMRPDKEVE